ncbi:unnamed protein product [Phytophthora lilii]|uniref:Unnamed protein product n=1 Tax=Phytophthora lilii TaxID=2077276 RepID=A0A9W6TKB1_9STRA|nr:unnamed protein product [Phytophthora lilii]
MERELFAQVAARAAQLGLDARRLDAPVLSDAELWTRANEILKRTRGSDESVSAAWVHRFKKRHGLHRSQLRRAAADAEADAEPALEAASGAKRAAAHQLTDTTSPRKRPATAASTAASASATAAAAAAAPGNRPHFVSAEDILLLTQVLDVKPWAAAYAMDGWQQVVDKLRADCAFRLEKTAGACQARVNLLLSHMKSGNMTALRKSGTKDEFERKCALLREVAAQMEVHERMQQGGDNVGVLAVSGLEPTAIVGPTAVSPINAGLVDLAQERERMAQRRLELMERKMERELAAQKRHSQEQVERLEKLHREQ